jgi:hypothetical protein
MAGWADCLQVVRLIESTEGFCDDVVNVFCWPVSACFQAYLTQAFVSRQDQLAQFVPCSAVSALVSAASIRVSKRSSRLMFLAVA